MPNGHDTSELQDMEAQWWTLTLAANRKKEEVRELHKKADLMTRLEKLLKNAEVVTVFEESNQHKPGGSIGWRVNRIFNWIDSDADPLPILKEIAQNAKEN